MFKFIIQPCNFSLLKKYSEFLAANVIPSYVPPTYNRLRTLLAQEKTNIDRKTQLISDTWKWKGLSICSAGWFDIKRRLLKNITGASSGGPIF